MESVYKICFYGGLVLAILLVIAAVALFVILKIPRVFDELTGRSEKKGIRSLKAGHGEGRNIDKVEQAKYYNQNSGKIKVRQGVSAEKRKENNDDTTDLLGSGAATEDVEVTEVLGAGKYTDMSKDSDIDATEILGDGSIGEDDGETEVLSGHERADNKEDVADDDADEATDVLISDDDSDEATDVLVADDDADEATDVLVADNCAEYDETMTDVLRVSDYEDDEEMTTVLNREMTDELAGKTRVYYNIVVTHSDERL